MNYETYQFRVYHPAKGVLLLIGLMAVALVVIRLMDLYGPDWMQHREVRILGALIVTIPAIYPLAKRATNYLEVKIEQNGIWLYNLPKWTWGEHESRRIGWLELESWQLKKGKIDGHSISWDRLIFKLSNGEKLLLLPTDDFDERSGFPVFILRLEQAVNAYNGKPTTHLPIQNGMTGTKNMFWTWLKLIFWLIFLAMILTAMYLAVVKGAVTKWPLLGGALFMLLAVGYQILKQFKSIRNAVKS